MAVLGELGRYPVLIPALRHCLKYCHHLNSVDSSSIISIAITDMKNNSHIDCWLTRIEKVKTLNKLKRLLAKSDKAGAIIDKNIKSKFDKFFLTN